MLRAPIIRLLAVATLWATSAVAACAQESANNAGTYSLHFANGDFLAGRLLESGGANSLTWRSAAFAAPLHFTIGAVQSIQFKQPITAKGAGPYCVELAGGDVLYGSLVALDEHEAVVQTGGVGMLHLDRAIVHRLIRTGAGDLLFAGPTGLDGWETAGPANAWHEEGGQLRTSQPDATLRRSFSLPPLARFELELSWSSLPNFELAVGVDKSRPAIRPIFRLETWGDELVIVRESERAADFRSLQKLTAGPGQIHLQALYDQKQGRLLVVSPSGEKLAELNVPEEKAPPSPIAAKGKPTLFKLPAAALAAAGGVQVVHRRGGIKLQRLTISRWSGYAPEPPEPGKVWVHHTDGSSRSADVRSYDTQSRQFVLREGDADQRLHENRIERIVLSRSDTAEPRSVR